MTVSWRGKRIEEGRRSPSSVTKARGAPSVREVCVLGLRRAWTGRDRPTWSGRSYRVEARPVIGLEKIAAYASLVPLERDRAPGVVRDGGALVG